MDIHAPMEPIHSWRDFAIHLTIVTIGLFIALMLEAGVEALHNRHLLHTAQHNLRSELNDNRSVLVDDEHHLDVTQKQIEDGLTILDSIKSHKTDADLPAQNWNWNSPQAAAWETARDSGALALMSYEEAESYNVVYGQQRTVNDQASLYIRDIYDITAPLHGTMKLSDLSPTQLDAMIAASNQALADLHLLRDYCLSLGRIYSRAKAS
ncbi:MAG: hypothetical protein WBY53_17100 [Acidobacteriaceae bacterium]